MRATLQYLAIRPQTGDEGSGLDTLIDSLPTDPGSLFVLLLAVAAIVVTVHFGRTSGKASDAARRKEGTPGDD